MRHALVAVLALLGGATVWAGSIDTSFIEAPWPKQHVHETEVGRYAVRWRERASKLDGIFAGVHFAAPLDQRAVWDLANNYQDVGQMTPGVMAVRYLERSETHETVQIDVKVLWKTLTLTFEVEKEPPSAMRFRLVNEALGEYRGLCLFTPSPDPAGKTSRVPAARLPLRLSLIPGPAAGRSVRSACG